MRSCIIVGVIQIDCIAFALNKDDFGHPAVLGRMLQAESQHCCVDHYSPSVSVSVSVALILYTFAETTPSRIEFVTVLISHLTTALASTVLSALCEAFV